ncbi:MAG: hypothetical protein HY817_02715 [Candidatus Abawacabacteria bacterium]|nr:hypothetical protein [Candidatus Abawacabacteria bacterium]
MAGTVIELKPRISTTPTIGPNTPANDVETVVVSNDNDMRSELKKSAHAVWKNRDALPAAFEALHEDPMWVMLFNLFEHLTDAFVPTVMEAQKRAEKKATLQKAILMMWYVYNQAKDNINKANPKADTHLKTELHTNLLDTFQHQRTSLRQILHTPATTQDAQKSLNALSRATISTCAAEISNNPEERQHIERLLALARTVIAEAVHVNSTDTH